jgi:hypothetical protein
LQTKQILKETGPVTQADVTHFLWWKGKEKDLPLVDTSDWQTHRFEQYGMELKLPKGWGMFKIYPSGYAEYQEKKGFEKGIICIRNSERSPLYLDQSTKEYKKINDFNDCIIQIDNSGMCLSSECDFNYKKEFIRNIDGISFNYVYRDKKMYWSEINKEIVIMYTPSYINSLTVINFGKKRWLSFGWTNRNNNGDYIHNNNDLGVF